MSSEPDWVDSAQPDAGGPAMSRRGFLERTAVVSAGVAIAPATATAAATTAGTAASAIPDDPVDIVLSVNGGERRLRVDSGATLLDTLRDRLNLVGSKKGCDRGQCGACTVHVDGQRVLSCLIFAWAAENKPIATIEGLARGEQLHPMQQAFIDCDALQCGFCTPGQVMSAVALAREGRARSDDEIRESMSGNICRCGAYNNIVEAVKAGRQSGGGH